MTKLLAMITIAVCMLVFVVSHAEGLTCGSVVKSLLPCRNYLRNGGSNVPVSCCFGARSLNRAASTTSDRQQACRCMKTAGRAYKVKPRYASAIPSKCKVNVGYAISFNTNCDKIH